MNQRSVTPEVYHTEYRSSSRRYHVQLLPHESTGNSILYNYHFRGMN